MAKKKEKKAGKRMKKKELVKVLLEFFHTKQDEVLSLKYIFEQLHLTTHPLKMLCMDILSELSMDDYITEVDKHKYKLFIFFFSSPSILMRYREVAVCVS